jgi:hypothetical protein
MCLPLLHPIKRLLKQLRRRLIIRLCPTAAARPAFADPRLLELRRGKQVVERKTRSTSFHCIQARASSVVELWFPVADFPKGAVGADVVTKAALLALLLDLQFAVWEKRHRDFAVTCFFRHEHRDIVLDRRFA